MFAATAALSRSFDIDNRWQKRLKKPDLRRPWRRRWLAQVRLIIVDRQVAEQVGVGDVCAGQLRAAFAKLA